MNRNKLKQYAPQARRDCIAAVTDRAAYYGLTRDTIEPITEQGDVVVIAGKPFPRPVAAKRNRLEERITRQGFEPTMEAMAYTWFNRFAAIRFMELHGYLEHGYRVLSHPDPEKSTPEILEHAEHVDLPGLNQTTVIDLKLDGAREAELYRMLLIAQCNALHAAMPFLFERIDDETELLLPDNLLHSDSLIRKLVNGIDEEDWQEVEIIGWLYQFYISEKKDQVIGKVVKSEDIPAATQLFTPNWIVKYLVQNSLGRQWMATYPNSPLKQQMAYYIEPAEQTPEVQAQLKAITPESLNPEELTLLDPACGSGHILVEAYDLFKAIYQERGYRARDIPSLILQKNLYGLEIDDRAAQLAAFALMMKARADERRIFSSDIQPHVLAIQESKGLDAKEITGALNAPLEYDEKQDQTGDISYVDVVSLIDLFEHGKTFGSLIRVSEKLIEKLPAIAERVQDMLTCGGMFGQAAAKSFKPFVEQTRILSGNYGAIVTNPPYMGLSYFNPRLKSFIKKDYLNGRSDLYAAFILRNLTFCKADGWVAMITIPNWMTIVTFEALRDILINSTTIESLIDNGRGVWGADFGSCSFALKNSSLQGYRSCFKRLYVKQGSVSTNEEIQRQFLSQDIFVKPPDSFKVIPTKPFAYWISDAVISVFQHHPAIGDGAKKGLSTGDNDRFLRCWHEVDFGKTSMAGSYKWFPVTKGGPFRRWYGNYDYILNWHKDGDELRNFVHDNGKARSVIRNSSFYFQSGVTWNDITISSFSARWVPQGFIPMDAGPIIYTKDWKRYLCMLNSTVNWKFMSFLAPTCHFTVGTIASIPVVQSNVKNCEEIASDAIVIVKADWDTNEVSWEFERTPLFSDTAFAESVQDAYTRWASECNGRFSLLKCLEEENNRIFIEAYGLQDELSPEVPEDQITLYRPNREEDTRRLLSYAIGCMMGRYSLDTPGLIYADSGNDRFWDLYHEKHERHEKDKTGIFSYDSCLSWSVYPPDADGIIPIMETDWFPDDASNRLVEFISVAWPKEHLAENLTFIADSLGPNRNEQPRDTIRRYLATGFYKHHLSMYKRRPIYWLFSSGKQRAFQCLVYLHRYHEGTLSRMRTEYVIPLQGKMASRLDQLADDIAAANSTSHRKKLEKERDTLRKQHMELQAFDEQLRHYADRRISLDLDDGVKVNYGKFGALLAEVKAVTGESMDKS